LDKNSWLRNCPFARIQRVILFKNPKNNQEAYLNVPPPDRIKDFTIFRICTKLAIPIPTHTEYMKILNEKLKNDHNI